MPCPAATPPSGEREGRGGVAPRLREPSRRGRSTKKKGAGGEEKDGSMAWGMEGRQVGEGEGNGMACGESGDAENRRVER